MVIPKGSCKYCGEQSGNLSVHERACEKNPANITQPTKEQPPQPRAPLIIKDIKEIQDPILSAYFQFGDKQYVERIPEFHGIIQIGDEDIPTVLITANDGRILPPFMIEGFIGMFAPEQSNPEPEAPKEPEPKNAAVEAIRNFARVPEAASEAEDPQ